MNLGPLETILAVGLVIAFAYVVGKFLRWFWSLINR